MTAYHPTRPRQEPVARSRKEQISDRVTAAINADGLRPWDLAGPQMCRLKFDLLGDAERIINLDPEITHGALQLRMAEQQLHCSQIASLLVNLCWLRSAQRMRAICRAIEPGAVRPCGFPRKRLGDRYRPSRASRAASHSPTAARVCSVISNCT